MKARAYKVFDRTTLMRVAGWIAQMLVSEERPILIEVTDFKERKTRQQEKLYHAILGDVAQQVEVDGKRFSALAWKEYFVRKYVGTEDVVLPTGEIIHQRKSTTDLSAEDYSELIDKTLGELAMEYGYLPQEMAA